jgi:hypothetical protein
MRIIFLITVLILVAGCKNKKKTSVPGEDPVTVEDFVKIFPVVNLPYQFTDTSLNLKKKDSLIINYKVFSQFVPDSVARKFFGKNARPKIYPMASIKVPGGETYLVAKMFLANKPTAYLLGFDPKNNFISMMPALQPDADPSTQQAFSVDRRYNLSRITTKKNSDGTLSDGKEVYALSPSAKGFVLIMTDVLDEKNVTLINPIDTFARKNKYSADYIKDKKNIVSLRDNKKPDRLTFFIHLDKNNSDCTGELKGEAVFTSPNTAVYRPSGDPCSVQFKFSSSAVSISEMGCGSHRGIDCLFEGTYPRKKQITPKKTKSIPKTK